MRSRIPPYMPLFTSDFLRSVREARMTPEEIGGLLMFMLWQWESWSGTVPHDSDRFAGFCGWDKRRARSVLDKLIARDKVRKTEDGRLYNERLASEITQYITRARAAEERERAKAAGGAVSGAHQGVTVPPRMPTIADTSPRLRAVFPETSPELPREVDEKPPRSSGDLFENVNKINEGASRDGPPNIREGNIREGTESAPAGAAALKRVSRKGFSAAQIKLTDDAIDLYNRAAEKMGFVQCKARTDAIRARLLKRLADIGEGDDALALQNFRRALWAVRHDPFLSGRSTKDTPEPFKLSIHHLLQTEGKMADVLASLINKADEEDAHAGAVADPRERVRAMSDDEQYELCQRVVNGRWPYEVVFEPPGDPACPIRATVLARLGIDDTTYDRHGIRRDHKS